MQYTKANIQDGINAKIDALSFLNRYKRWLEKRVKCYPQEIEQNIIEWINDLPLTDIDCHGESIVKIMHKWNFSEQDIAKLICGFIDFKESDWQMPNYIWQSVTGLGIVYDGQIPN